MRRKPKPPTLPGIEVWYHRIDERAYALFACRRWDHGPRLTVWRIITADEGDGWDMGWRGRGAAMLLEAEERVDVRWYVRVQRRIALSAMQYGPGTAVVRGNMEIWNDHVQRPKPEIHRENAGWGARSRT